MDLGESYTELVQELAELCGIASEYSDVFGKRHVTSHETKMAILRAMKLSIGSADDVRREIGKRKWRPWRDFIEPVVVTSVNTQPVSIPVCLPLREGVEKGLRIIWTVTDEQNHCDTYSVSGEDIIIMEEKRIDGERHVKVNLRDNRTRDIGYYEVHVECSYPEPVFPGGKGHCARTARLILSPDTCYMPPELQNGRAWGLSLNLYAVRSAHNWGIGDFGDLRDLLSLTSKLGADFVGINPLHAVPNTMPYGISPYSPISRLFRNFIYLDIDRIPDVVSSDDAQNFIRSEKFRTELAALRERNLIDYELVASLKKEVLRRAFETFYQQDMLADTPKGREFKSFLFWGGALLDSFALFSVLREHMIATHRLFTWEEWPEEYRTPKSDAVRDFREGHEKDVLFEKYLQWLIEGRLADTVEAYRNHGMQIGLYNDLAIGATGGGSDVWANQDIYGIADVGAPPDDFSPFGQNWGFPPMIPEKLKEKGYTPFIETIRRNMRHGGALRIDHALGLFRLFWVPQGLKPAEGTYVQYPSEDLLRIIALESVRSRTIVIAEDLGTVGENVRESLRQFHMLSYRLFYFERNYPNPAFVTPDQYPELALCAVTTHDLPTLYGFWVGRDIEVRRELGKYPHDELWRQQLEERQRDKELILSALKEQDILPEGFPSTVDEVPRMTSQLCTAVYEYLAKTPCGLVLVSLDDVIGTLNQQNMPGTVDTHPNWIQKMPIMIETLKNDERLKSLSEMLNKYINA